MSNYHQRFKTLEERFWEKVDKCGDDECWMWKATKNGRYGVFMFDNKKILAHRVSWTLKNGDIPEGFYVCHHCDTPKCVNPSHLFLGTQFDNMRDMVNKGRNSDTRGELNPNSTLSVFDVIKIRNMRNKGKTYKEIMIKFDIGQTQVSRIINRQSWSWLK